MVNSANTIGRHGPILTSFGGELEQPMLVCTGCNDLRWQDTQRAYCAALAQPPHASLPGQGQLIHAVQPYPDCPHVSSRRGLAHA